MSAVAPIQQPAYRGSPFRVANTAATLDSTIESCYLMLGSLAAESTREDKALDQLSYLCENYDGRGARAPDQRAIQSARGWLEFLRDEAERSGRSWRPPHISALGDGEISFEWWRKDRKVSLYFGIGTPEFIKVWGAHIQNEMESGELQSSDTFGALWIWLNVTA